MIFRQKAMLRTAIRPKRKVVAGRTLRNGVARRGYRGVPVDDFRASFPLSGMTLSVVLGRTPWRAVRESYTDCREYMPLPPFVSPRPAEDVPAGCRSSAAAENAYFLTESGCESVGNIPTFSSGISCKKIFTTFCGQKYHKFGKKANVSIGIDNQVVFLSSSLYTGCRIGSRRHRQAWVQLPKHYLVRECLLFPKIVIYRLLHFHSS